MTGVALNDSKDGLFRAPPHRPEWGRFDVFPRKDGRYIVYDPRLPFGKRTVSDHLTAGDAGEAATLASEAAFKRCEPNDRENTGFRYDWNDPKVWDRFA